MPQQNAGSGLLNQIDVPTVIHAAIIAVVVIVLYHFLFQR